MWCYLSQQLNKLDSSMTMPRDSGSKSVSWVDDARGGLYIYIYILSLIYSVVFCCIWTVYWSAWTLKQGWFFCFYNFLKSSVGCRLTMEQPPKKTAACLCLAREQNEVLELKWHLQLTNFALVFFREVIFFPLISKYLRGSDNSNHVKLLPKDDSINQWPRCIWRGNCPEVIIALFTFFWTSAVTRASYFNIFIYTRCRELNSYKLKSRSSSCGDTQSLMILTVDSLVFLNVSWCFWESAYFVVVLVCVWEW